MHASPIAKVSDGVFDGQFDPHSAAIMNELAIGYWLPRCLHIVADLGVADHIATEPVSAKEIARRCGADEDALYRVMRALSARGIFEQTADGFVHSRLSQLLRNDHPHSMRPYVRMVGLTAIWNSFLHIEHNVRTGEMAALKVDPNGMFHYFQQNPAEGALFNDAMEAKARVAIAAVLKACDFSGFESVADIGGGKGHLVRAILDSVPNLKGILFDQPHVVATVSASDRFQVIGGDFFRGGIPASDVYILMEVLHDWKDEQAQQILKSIRLAAAAGSRLLIVETVMPEINQAHLANGLDIFMLALTGGRERTRKEHAGLLASAGFSLNRIVATESSYSIVEAVAV